VKKLLRSFRPFIDKRSRVLILGTMPGPMALAKREYYGFTGNHFWKIMADLFHDKKPFKNYFEKICCLKKNRIAIWDTIESCRRAGASDGAIKNWKPNNVPGLLKRHPGVKAVFLNGQMAHRIYRIHFEGKIEKPFYVLPSTSPAHASMSYADKRRKWALVKKI
jgi:hypoxanthine-DNA glycosylase